MCGIAGIVTSRRRNFDAERVRAAARLLTHRGPDDQGYVVVDGADVHSGTTYANDLQGSMLLLHHRLSIIEIGELGHQPMFSSTGRFAMVFNGEIYNYVELRNELIRQGRVFRGGSDSEVLLQAVEHWGTDAFSRFVGMFAVAIVDLERRTLTLARDHFGIKPLYYTVGEGTISFASEIPALFELTGRKRELNFQRTFDYLRFGMTDHGSDTMFWGVRQLNAGHHAVIDLAKCDDVEQVLYYEPHLGERLDLDFADAAARVRELFLRSVEVHLRSDVPVGTSLSGGIDSSAIVMASRALMPNVDRHAFTYVARGTSANEERYADIVAKAADCHIHKVEIDIDQMVDDLDALVLVQGEPFGSSRIYAQFCVFRRAHEVGVKVMLDGQGADELLAGYHTYIGARVASDLRRGRINAAGKLVRSSAESKAMLASVLHAGRFLLPHRAELAFRRLVNRDMTPAWMNSDWFAEREVVEKMPATNANDESSSVLLKELRDSIAHTNLPKLLRYEDRNSMAHSIESRVPFLEPNLVDFVLRLPEDHLISDRGVTKSVFRAAMRGLVPDEILDRTDKIGFETPEGPMNQALEAWAEPYFDDDQYELPAVFDGSEVRRFLLESDASSENVGFATWRIRNFVAWYHRNEMVDTSADRLQVAGHGAES